MITTEEKIKRRYLSHRKWVEKNKDKYRAYHKEYNSRPEVKERRRLHYLENIESYRKRDKAHYHKTKDRHSEVYRCRKYNISIEKYRELTSRKRCDICKKPEETKNKFLSIDHSHVTREVRGILCSKCNRALGLIKDNIKILEDMKNYLLKYAKN